MTLKFFGDLDNARRTELLDASQILADTTTALPELELGGLGVFPDLSRPRSIHARVAHGERETINLMNEVELAYADCGFEPETRPRRPHVTLFRVRGRVDTAILTDWMKQFDTQHWGPLETNRLVFYETETTPNGSVYHPVADFDIGPKAP